MTALSPALSPALSGAIWREVARHEGIAGSAAALAALLRPAMPLVWLMVLRWDGARGRLETAAHVGPVPPLPRQDLPTPRRDALLSWAAARAVTDWYSREATMLSRLCVPAGVTGRVLAGPLCAGEALIGLLLIGVTEPVDIRANEMSADIKESRKIGSDGIEASMAGRRLQPPPVIEQRLHSIRYEAPRSTAADVEKAQVSALTEPFSVALQNDQRLHELARLREAAEQDRSALLTRLAREDVSDAIVGTERGLREVMNRVGQVAPTDAPVLILGETGAGKEVVARAIHARSRRSSGPFLRVNCGAIPSELIDSELFGHEKGSFTGAISQRKGWFERADGGTLFLDEVAELPPAAQVRLLRVLQDGSFQRVGGQETHTVDVRIVAATHRDMAGMIRDGQFRQDLWYRISVFPVLLPALRDRRGDIPALARHFAHRAGLRLYGRALEPEEADLPLLSAYGWPGNVRELAAVIERAAILGNGHALHVAPALGQPPALLIPTPGAAPRSTDRPEDDRALLSQALERSLGRIEGPFGAAAALGVNPNTLRSRLRRLGIDWSRYRRSATCTGTLKALPYQERT